MKVAYLVLIFLFVQQGLFPDSLTINQQGEKLATINRTDFIIALPGSKVMDTKKLDHFIDDLEQQIYRAPINAKIDEQGQIISGQVGYTLDRQAFKEKFYHYFFSKGPSLIEITELPIYPKVDSELLAHIREERIGQYVTYFNTRNKNRSHNISLAAKAIDNYVVFPGEIFSFNEVVGKRTKETGYLRAPVIVKGELSQGVGGGICQVSSTLFNAVDNAGAEIVERYSHSRSVPYVPPGRDATVSWYGPDFRFQNKYNQPILIRAKAVEGKVFITIYSSDVIDYDSRQVPSAINKRMNNLLTVPVIKKPPAKLTAGENRKR
jgi:vancomycin resistance protein YoaR